MVIRFEFRFDHRVVLPRSAAAQALAPAKSCDFTLSKHDLMTFTIVVFCSPTCSVIRSGR